jgi:cytoskeletal protein CcmA (bactofilin family)
MQTAAKIGETIVIKGEITAAEDLTVAGRVEGSIKIEGHALTIAAGSSVLADVHAADVIVGGQFAGTATADRRIELAATADADGDFEAPAIAVADGATVTGRVTTTRERKPSLQLAS